MALDLAPVMADFDVASAARLGAVARYDIEALRAPHKATDLPPGHGAIYVFALAENGTCPAGHGKVLKVGRVGANSNPRYRYQHYSSTSARSTLAGSLIRYPVLWEWLGVDHLDAGNVRAWMETNLDRVNVRVASESLDLLPQMEMYVRARVGSVFEGSA